MANWFHDFWQGFAHDFDLPAGASVGQIFARTLVAALLGGLLGFERERIGKAAGMRTHMLVSLAGAFFIIVVEQAGATQNEVSRVIQGLAAGIGFLGAGTILKHNQQSGIVGLTTAAGLYFTAAIGVAAGMGREVTAILGTLLGLFVLAVLPLTESWLFGLVGGKLSPKERTPSGTSEAAAGGTESSPADE